MSIVDAELDLSTEEDEIARTVHRFAEEVLRPIGQELDRYPDPADVIAPGSPLWTVFDRYRELGVDDIGFGGGGGSLSLQQQARLRCIVSEELGWGDAGLAISLGVSGFPRTLAMFSGKPELVERFGGDREIGCWPITEPDHGSDLIMFGIKGERFPGRPNCLAVRDGDHYVITGQKAAWVSNGTIATSAALFCSVDDTGNGSGPTGMGGFLVPLDLPGVKRGKPLDKLGQRALNQGEIFFEDVRIPASHLVMPPEVFNLGGGDMILTQANSGMGSTFVGLAQAAFDVALQYTKDRIQGGVPIFEHQSVRARLFVMFRKVEAARALNRRVVLQNQLAMPPQSHYAVASKVTSTQFAFEVASDALQLFGGNGLSREYPIEKMLRDARASMIEDGCNEVLAIAAAGRL